MGQRDRQKQQTRERVVAAARELFDEIGYENTTVRMIALRAGVSVGSVFTTFDSKVAVFNHILFERFEALFAELDRILPYLKGSAADRLCSIMSIAYGVEGRDLKMMMAHLAASHGWPPEIEAQSRQRMARLEALFRAALDHGVTSGELCGDLDLDLCVEMLRNLYLSNYRKAFYDRLDAQALSAHAERQVAIFIRGLRPEPLTAEG